MTLTLKVDANAAYNAVLQQKQVPYAMNLAMNSWMFSTNKFLEEQDRQLLRRRRGTIH